MSAADEEDGGLFEMSSFQEWLNDQNAKLDGDGVAPNAVDRAWRIAGETPLKFFTAVAYRAAYGGTRNFLRRQNRRAVPTGDGSHRHYLSPEQMELPNVLAFLIANSDRRLADVRAERRFIKDWCEAHEGYAPEAIYALAGVSMPAGPED